MITHTPYPTLLFLLKTRQPPRSPLFPYTTLFRSRVAGVNSDPDSDRRRDVEKRAAHRALDRFGTCNGSSRARSEEHTSELQSHVNLVCRLLLEKKKHIANMYRIVETQLIVPNLLV